jgi:hypothetical protein
MMERSTRLRRLRLGSLVVVGSLALAAIPTVGFASASTGTASSVATKKKDFRPPVMGKWKIKHDPDFSGGFKIKGTKKKPKITNLSLTVLTDEGPTGIGCLPVGTTLTIKGSITLKKGKKFTNSTGSFGHWWLIAARDGKYDKKTYYNYLGVKPLPVKVQVSGGGTVNMLLAGFWDTNVSPKKQELTRFTLIDPDEQTNGWCRYDPLLFGPAK